MEKKLKVWWIPQVPMKPYEVVVSNVAEAVKIMDVLAGYDAFMRIFLVLLLIWVIAGCSHPVTVYPLWPL